VDANSPDVWKVCVNLKHDTKSRRVRSCAWCHCCTKRSSYRLQSCEHLSAKIQFWNTNDISVTIISHITRLNADSVVLSFWSDLHKVLNQALTVTVTNICKYVCMYVFMCMYVCMYVRIYVCKYVCMYAWCMYVSMHVCVYVRTYICMHDVCIHACMYECMYVCMYVCM